MDLLFGTGVGRRPFRRSDRRSHKEDTTIHSPPRSGSPHHGYKDASVPHQSSETLPKFGEKPPVKCGRRRSTRHKKLSSPTNARKPRLHEQRTPKPNKEMQSRSVSPASSGNSLGNFGESPPRVQSVRATSHDTGGENKAPLPPNSGGESGSARPATNLRGPAQPSVTEPAHNSQPFKYPPLYKDAAIERTPPAGATSNKTGGNSKAQPPPNSAAGSKRKPSPKDESQAPEDGSSSQKQREGKHAQNTKYEASSSRGESTAKTRPTKPLRAPMPPGWLVSDSEWTDSE